MSHNDLKLQLIRKYFDKIKTHSTRRASTRTHEHLLNRLVGYSMAPEDVSYAVKFIKQLTKLHSAAALQILVETHSMRLIKEACRWLEYQHDVHDLGDDGTPSGLPV